MILLMVAPVIAKLLIGHHPDDLLRKKGFELGLGSIDCVVEEHQ